MIADDHPLSREGLAIAARVALPGLTIDFAGSIAEAEALIARYKRYRMALLDLLLPDARGFSGCLRLQFALGQALVVIVTALDEPALAATAYALGTAGFLSKTEPLDMLVAALREIAGGKRIFPSFARQSGLAGSMRDRIATLSLAQRRVLFALADGRLNKQIAGQLNVTEATIKAHMSAILRKLGVNNRMQAILALQPLLGRAADGPGT